MLFKCFDGLSRKMFVRFRLISLGGWLGLILDLRYLDLLCQKIFQYFVKTDQNQTNCSWLLCNFPTLTFSSEMFAIPGHLKKRVNIPTRYFSPGPPATPPRCSTGMGTTTTGTSTTPLMARGSPFCSTWPREASCQVWKNILENFNAILISKFLYVLYSLDTFTYLLSSPSPQNPKTQIQGTGGDTIIPHPTHPLGEVDVIFCQIWYH